MSRNSGRRSSEGRSVKSLEALQGAVDGKTLPSTTELWGGADKVSMTKSTPKAPVAAPAVALPQLSMSLEELLSFEVLPNLKERVAPEPIDQGKAVADLFEQIAMADKHIKLQQERLMAELARVQAEKMSYESQIITARKLYQTKKAAEFETHVTYLTFKIQAIELTLKERIAMAEMSARDLRANAERDWAAELEAYKAAQAAQEAQAALDAEMAELDRLTAPEPVQVVQEANIAPKTASTVLVVENPNFQEGVTIPEGMQAKEEPVVPVKVMDLKQVNAEINSTGSEIGRICLSFSGRTPNQEEAACVAGLEDYLEELTIRQRELRPVRRNGKGQFSKEEVEG
jgi:hypothetical protein